MNESHQNACLRRPRSRPPTPENNEIEDINGLPGTCISNNVLLIYTQNLFLWLRTRGNIASAAPSATFLSADVQFVGKPPRKVWAKSFHTNLKKSMTWNVRTDLETHSMSIILTNIHQLQVEETFLVSYDASLVLHHSAEKTVFGSRGPQLPKHRSFTRSHFSLTNKLRAKH